MSELNEKRIDFEERKEALATFLGLNEEEKEEIEEGYTDGALEYGKEEYLVLTDDEADDMFREQQEQIFDDLGIESYSEDFQDWIFRNALKEDWFEEAMEESNRSYCEDIVRERSREFENRLVEECYERDLIEDDDFEQDEDGDPDFEKCLVDEDDLINRMMEDMAEDDPVEWFRDNFGESELSDAVKDHNLIDLDEVIDELQKWDGRGPTLAGWDGNENEEGDFFIYRTN